MPGHRQPTQAGAECEWGRTGRLELAAKARGVAWPPGHAWGLRTTGQRVEGGEGEGEGVDQGVDEAGEQGCLALLDYNIFNCCLLRDLLACCCSSRRVCGLRNGSSEGPQPGAA